MRSFTSILSNAFMALCLTLIPWGGYVHFSTWFMQNILTEIDKIIKQKVLYRKQNKHKAACLKVQ